MDRVYVGVRLDEGCKVFVWDGLSLQPLEPRLDVRSHSPSGFEWGYTGSGPAQLALALCLDAFEDQVRVHTIYHEVMRHVLVHLPRAVWRMDAATLRDMCDWLWAQTAAELQERMRHERASRSKTEPEGGEG